MYVGSFRRMALEAVPVALAGTALAVAFFGRGVVAHLGTRVHGAGTDPLIFVWSMRWWPYAFAHGLDPLTTHVVWPGDDYAVLSTSSVPGLSLLGLPLTWAYGPVAAYNVLSLLAPGLAAGAVYVLCRALGARRGAAGAAALLFALSPYEAGAMQGHLHVSFVAPAILAAGLVVLFAREGRVTPWRVAGVTAALILQFLIGPEVFITLCGAALVAIALVHWLDPARRAAAAIALRYLAAGVALAVLVVSPLVVNMVLRAPAAHNASVTFSTDLLNLLVPTRLTQVNLPGSAAVADTFRGNPSEQLGYLGPVLVALLVSFAVRKRTRTALRVPLAFLAVSLLASFGPLLHVAGVRTLPLPMLALTPLPGLGNVLPSRLALFEWLAIAVLLALWLSAPGPRWRWVALAAVVLTTAPAVTRASFWHDPVHSPAFFAQGAYRDVLRGHTVLYLPAYADPSLRWQAEGRFSFDVAIGMIPDPPRADGDKTVAAVAADRPDLISPAEMSRFLRHEHADLVVIRPPLQRRWGTLLATVGMRPRRVVDVILYTYPAGQPAHSVT